MERQQRKRYKSDENQGKAGKNDLVLCESSTGAVRRVA